MLLMPSNSGGEAPNINMPGCGVFSNSTRVATLRQGSSISLQGNFTFYAGSVGTAGCVDINGSNTIGDLPQPSGCTVNGISQCTDNYTQNDGQVADPYAGIPVPTTGTPLSSPPATATYVLRASIPNLHSMAADLYVATRHLHIGELRW